MKRIALIASLGIVGLAFCLLSACNLTTAPTATDVLNVVTNFVPLIPAKTNSSPEVISNVPPVVVATPSNVPPAVVVPVVTNAPAGIVDAIDATKIHIVNGANPAKAKATLEISNVRFGQNSVSCDGDHSGFKDRYTGANGKTVNCEWQLYWIRNGEPYGGRFDDAAPTQNSKDLNNMPVSPKGGILRAEPDAGATVYLCIISRNGKERSNIARAVNGYRGK